MNIVDLSSAESRSRASRTIDVAGAASSRDTLFVKLLVALGYRLGLFEALNVHGKTSAPELAMRLGLDERSISDWLTAMAEAGYLESDPTTHRFGIPANLAGCRSTKFGGRAVLELYSPD